MKQEEERAQEAVTGCGEERHLEESRP